MEIAGAWGTGFKIGKELPGGCEQGREDVWEVSIKMACMRETMVGLAMVRKPRASNAGVHNHSSIDWRASWARSSA